VGLLGGCGAQIPRSTAGPAKRLGTTVACWGRILQTFVMDNNDGSSRGVLQATPLAAGEFPAVAPEQWNDQGPPVSLGRTIPIENNEQRAGTRKGTKTLLAWLVAAGSWC
jgi:hypothetical protein